MINKKEIKYVPLSQMLIEYSEKNTNNVYSPVAVGKYGIRRRDEIYKKELAKDYSKNKLIYKNTLTIGMGSNQIDIGILNEDAIYSVSPAYHTFKISNVKNQYLDYCLKNRNKEMFDLFVKKSARQGKNIDIKKWLDYKVPVYDYKSQEEIENTISTIEQLINSNESKIDNYNELIKARFVEMFGSINNNKYGYDVKTIQEVCEPIKDGTHQTPTYTEDSINGFKFLSSKDVVTGKVDWNHLKYIPADLHEQLYARLAPKKGDILLAKNGTTGIAAIVDRDEIFDIYVSLALLRPLETVTSDYLCNAINSFETKTQFNERLKGVGVPNLHLGEIKQTRIVVPPMDKQNEFTTFVREIDKSKFVNQKLYILYRKLLLFLSSSIFIE